MMLSPLYCNSDLKILELTHNQIHTLPDDIGVLRHLECLYLRHNKLTSLPLLDNCTALKVSAALLCVVSFAVTRLDTGETI